MWFSSHSLRVSLGMAALGDSPGTGSPFPSRPPKPRVPPPAPPSAGPWTHSPPPGPARRPPCASDLWVSFLRAGGAGAAALTLTLTLTLTPKRQAGGGREEQSAGRTPAPTQLPAPFPGCCGAWGGREGGASPAGGQCLEGAPPPFPLSLPLGTRSGRRCSLVLCPAHCRAAGVAN